jgi:diaminopimelate decarboxylase
VSAGRECRFGFTAEDLQTCRPAIGSNGINVIGFHVFAGSQVLAAEKVVGHLRRAFDISRRAADTLGIEPKLFNLGGGFGIPYAVDDKELNLVPISDALRSMIEQATPVRLVLELGRYLVAQAGWYLTSVLGLQTHQGRPAVVVDGGTHQRADLCGLCLRSKARPEALAAAPTSSRVATDVLGCLSLPADVLAESTLLPPLAPGDVLGFPDAGAYGLWSSPALFHGSPLPAEVAFDGSRIQLMRTRRLACSILDDQEHVVCGQQTQVSVRDDNGQPRHAPDLQTSK